jgi:hypothetical protein
MTPTADKTYLVMTRRGSGIVNVLGVTPDGWAYCLVLKGLFHAMSHRSPPRASADWVCLAIEDTVWTEKAIKRQDGECQGK